jgi:hypothetical protein
VKFEYLDHLRGKHVCCPDSLICTHVVQDAPVGTERKIEHVKLPKRVTTPPGITELPYQLWLIPEFPLDRLKFTPLEDVEGETTRRVALCEDIERRGLLNPLIVWNHTPSGQRGSPRPYYLHFGYNKLWCLKRLGRTHARAFLTLDVGRAPEFPCMGCPSPRVMIDEFHEGTLVLGFNGPVFKDVSSIANWQLPA